MSILGFGPSYAFETPDLRKEEDPPLVLGGGGKSKTRTGTRTARPI